MEDESAISRKDYETFWKKMAYFFGAWLGDGWATWNPYSRSYSVGIKCMDSEIVERCYIEVTSTIYDLEGRYYSEATKNGTKLHKLMFYSKLFSEFMLNATSHKTMMPEFIWMADKQERLDFLAGLMDTDGTILKQKNSKCRDGFFYRMVFTNTKMFANQFPDLLRVIGINLTGDSMEIHKSLMHAPRRVFNISIPSAIDNGFYFHCSRKQSRLNDYVERSRTRYSDMSDTRMGIKSSETTRSTT